LTVKAPVLVVFFKITCPVCQFTLPFLNRLHAAGELAVYGISQDDDADTREFNQEFGIQFPVLLDSEDAGYPASNAYGISNVPSLFLITGEGKIERVIEGWSKKEMQTLGVIRPGDNVPEWKAG
jgi:peroxiredoxin